jgi:hypothetical protein
MSATASRPNSLPTWNKRTKQEHSWANKTGNGRPERMTRFRKRHTVSDAIVAQMPLADEERSDRKDQAVRIAGENFGYFCKPESGEVFVLREFLNEIRMQGGNSQQKQECKNRYDMYRNQQALPLDRRRAPSP